MTSRRFYPPAACFFDHLILPITLIIIPVIETKNILVLLDLYRLLYFIRIVIIILAFLTAELLIHPSPERLVTKQAGRLFSI